MLTMPMLGVLKELLPEVQITFLGNDYTEAILRACQHVDHFLSWKRIQALPIDKQVAQLKALEADAIIHVFPKKEIATLAKKARIPLRIGTSHRLYHLLTCNSRPSFSRKKSNLHEAQLNLKLLQGLGKEVSKSLQELPDYYGFAAQERIPDKVMSLLDREKPSIILHPKSKGSAVEWGTSRFIELAALLADTGYQVLFTGTETEGEQFRAQIPPVPELIDLSGRLSLAQLIGLIEQSHGLVAASTGPLHIAAALGKAAIGLYAPRRPIHPGRWMPVGKKAAYVVADEDCKACASGKPCSCIEHIEPQQIIDVLNRINSEA